MRRSDLQLTDPLEIERILSNASLCHLAMVDAGRPYVVPMNFGYADGTLYFHSAPAGRKIDIVRKSPEVCFNVVGRYDLVAGESACAYSARYTSVTGTGRAEIITEREAIEDGLKILMTQYSEVEYGFSDVKLDGVVVIKVEIESLMGKSSETGIHRR